MTGLCPVQHIWQSYVWSSTYDGVMTGLAYMTVLSGPVNMTEIYPVQYIWQSYVWANTYDGVMSGPVYMTELCLG